MPRAFNGSTGRITLALGAMGFAFGPGTLAIILKVSADGVAHVPFYAGADGTDRWGVLVLSDGKIRLTLAASADSPAGIDTCLIEDGWLLLAVTKASGTVAPRFHRYEYATGVWQHANSATALANSNVPATSVRIGANFDATIAHNGAIANIGAWNVVLTDAEIEALAYSLPAWLAEQPKALLPLDQATVAQTVNDISGGGANETARNGTTVSTSSVPVFSYGAPVLYVSANEAEILAAVMQLAAMGVG